MPTVCTVALHGLTGHLQAITATVVDGPPGITLADPQRPDYPELRDRVHAALANSGQPNRDYHVDVRVDGPAGTPPAAAVATAAIIATATLAEDMPQATMRIADTAVLGEVGLDGSLRPTRGTLPAARAARAQGLRRVIVPAATLGEAALVDGLDVLGAHTLANIADWLRGDDTALHGPSIPTGPVPARQPGPMTALTAAAHRAVTIAAAGGHHLLADVAADAPTPPLASWLHALLPDLTPDQQLELAEIQSLIGPREDGAILVSTPPMVTARLSERHAARLGAAPGLVNQAHHGVLVVDLDQFNAAAQDALRAVLIQRAARINQAGRLHDYPAAVQLLATSLRASRSRRWRLSLALRDAIDIQITVDHTVINTGSKAHNTADIAHLLTRTRAQVAAARTRAAHRWSLGPTVTNAAVAREVLHGLEGGAAVVDRVRRAQDAGRVSHRGGDIAVRLAWTIADLDGADTPSRDHIEQALALRRGLEVGTTRTGVR